MNPPRRPVPAISEIPPEPGRQRPPIAPVLIAPGITAGAVAGLLVVARFYERIPIHPPPCGLRTLTGIPCIGCGGTRSMMSLAHGDFPGALAFNPLAAVGALAAFVWLAVALIRWQFFSADPAPTPTPMRRPLPLRWIVTLVVALFAANWAYLILYLPP